MNLKLHLLTRIAAAGLLCLLITLALVLQQSAAHSASLAQNTLTSLGKQLEFQLLRISAGDKPDSPFPDFDLWKQTASEPGICASYQAVGGSTRSFCKGINLPAHPVPKPFVFLYRQFFNPEQAWQRSINFDNRNHGELSVSVSAELAIAKAWENTRHLIGLSAITITTICLLAYLTINRALRPAHTIVAGLDRLRLGDLSYRLPDFELHEWRQTATAVNQLAANQQKVLAERQKLAVMLMNLQEEERRHLARELHDELGQCLTGIHAVSASISQTAATHYPALLVETEQIARFSQAMQRSVRDLLTQLRPAELDELGLPASLNSLVARWNRLSTTRFELAINGDCRALSEPITITLFRITQEAITNTAKHAFASQAKISVDLAVNEITLTIADDGIASCLPFTDTPGIGLLGMRERALALGGQFILDIAAPHGLIIKVSLPLPTPQTGP